jgi:hypothetical protein
MSKPSRRVALIVIGGLIVFLSVAHYFGWIAEAPPLLAPGIQ